MELFKDVILSCVFMCKNEIVILNVCLVDEIWIKYHGVFLSD